MVRIWGRQWPRWTACVVCALLVCSRAADGSGPYERAAATRTHFARPSLLPSVPEPYPSRLPPVWAAGHERIANRPDHSPMGFFQADLPTPGISETTNGFERQPSPDGSSFESMFPPVGDLSAATSSTPSTEPSAAVTSGSGYNQGLEWELWGWLSFLNTPQQDFNSFWAYEFELGIHKAITQDIAATAQIDFMDLPGNEIFTEQLFVSIVLPQFDETILTAGKFNSPFGVEPRDFWNRVSGSRTLLFRAQPQDLIGLMVTHRVAGSDLILRPMLVNSFTTETGFDNNKQPSAALMAEYQLHDSLVLGGTYWYGPEMDDQVGNQLQFASAQAAWHLTQCLFVAGEYNYGITESPTGTLDWNGYLLLANYDLCDTFRVFGQWSVLDDRDAFQTGTSERVSEFNTGFGWYLHPLVEVRAEYRHDYRPISGDLDTYAVHLTFGL